MARKKKTIDDTHNFGVPSADDEGKSSVQKVKDFFKAEPKPSRELPKDDIKTHSKFDKFKGENK